MGIHRHVGGSLKQANKKHKGEKKHVTGTKTPGRLGVTNKHVSKKARRQHAKQQRLVKNKRVSVAQKQVEQPLMCLLLPLCDLVDVTLAQVMLSKGDPNSLMHELPKIQLQKNSYKASYLYNPALRKAFCLVNGKYNDLFGSLDLARLSDWIIFVLPGEISKIDPDSYSELLSVLYSQGMPPSVFVVMSNLSDRNEILSVLQSKFPVSDGKIRLLNSNHDAQSLLRFFSQSQKKPVLSSAKSYLVTPNALQVGTAATRLRSGMLVEAINIYPHEENEGEVYLGLEGLLRGWDLPLFDVATSFTGQPPTGCPYVHITGWGDFPVRAATWTEYTPRPRVAQAAPQIFEWRATTNLNEGIGESLAVAWNEMNLDDDGDVVDTDDSEYSNKETAAMSIDEEDEIQVGDVPSDSDEESINLDVGESEIGSSKSTHFEKNHSISKNYAHKPMTVAEKIKAAKVEIQFPDEIETPSNVPARERFAKYRGLPSFSKCTWPTENDSSLPYEYSKIFRFANYSHNRRTVIKHTLRQLRQLVTEKSTKPLSIPSGSIASLTLGPLPQALGDSILEFHTNPHEPRPLTIWSLLPYEHCMSVLHFTMQKRQPDWRDIIATGDGSDVKNVGFDPDPIMSKEPMLFQVGIRRFIASPIYSQESKTTSRNSKMERFFTISSSPIVATVYAPVVYAPQTVLQFPIGPSQESSKVVVCSLVATGSVLSVDPTRAIVKRILLSGHPYKINKRSAIVRYMFHTPEDIDYFKPIQMYTKSGAVGHIKQSVGTHGLMKCLFDRQLNASDVVLMPLYKRVFPKVTFDQQVTPKIVDVDRISWSKTDLVNSQSIRGILKSKDHQDTRKLTHTAMLTPDEEALFV
ncbi:unnamed protein product [Mesocestoides corti]|uniref:Pre-rRNA-processing protein TSR1 homolog n=2 Tax=Mesocestoides corti TaxID=53468 RepID=A0A0R3UFK5_MESCO|nr:unnamed protein product [Mesocestoides corti]